MAIGFPRSRGDRPFLMRCLSSAISVPPLTRGSTQVHRSVEAQAVGSPAHAGIAMRSTVSTVGSRRLRSSPLSRRVIHHPRTPHPGSQRSDGPGVEPCPPRRSQRLAHPVWPTHPDVAGAGRIPEARGRRPGRVAVKVRFATGGASLRSPLFSRCLARVLNGPNRGKHATVARHGTGGHACLSPRTGPSIPCPRTCRCPRCSPRARFSATSRRPRRPSPPPGPVRAASPPPGTSPADGRSTRRRPPATAARCSGRASGHRWLPGLRRTPQVVV
jgi:hypothetical protein